MSGTEHKEETVAGGVDSAAVRSRFILPTIFFAVAATCLLMSVFQPYWKMELRAPQYPTGLHVKAYLYKLAGDVREVDGLNHYIGMRPLGEAAQFERQVGMYAIIAMALLLFAAIFIPNRAAAYLAAPVIFYPLLFLLDLYLWLRNFGTNLDPKAPLSSSIKPFVPPVLGEGHVGQFSTVASPDMGLMLAMVASVLILVGLFLHRRAYKPLAEPRSASVSA